MSGRFGVPDRAGRRPPRYKACSRAGPDTEPTAMNPLAPECVMDDRDPVIEELLQMVRGEYLEMPNLSLAPPQMQRMWAMNERECTVVIAALVRDRFLYRTPNGHYVRPVPPAYRQRGYAQRTLAEPCRSGRKGS